MLTQQRKRKRHATTTKEATTKVPVPVCAHDQAFKNLEVALDEVRECFNVQKQLTASILDDFNAIREKLADFQAQASSATFLPAPAPEQALAPAPATHPFAADVAPIAQSDEDDSKAQCAAL